MFEERLISKKNEVYKRMREADGETCFAVEKEFTDARRFHMEHVVRGIAEKGGLTVPRLLDFEIPSGDFNGKLVYEFIDGDLALDLLAEDGAAEEVLSQIVAWMGRFYEIMPRDSDGEKWMLGDIHLRNFIYCRENQTVYGIDFEEAEKGDTESDVAKLFLFIATYEPAYSERHMRLAEHFLRESLSAFKLEKKRLLDEICLRAAQMGERRSCEIDAGLLATTVERTFDASPPHSSAPARSRRRSG